MGATRRATNGRSNVRHRTTRPVEPHAPAAQRFTSTVVHTMAVVGGAIVVRDTGAKGLGIFAARRIPAGAFVARFDGDRLSLSEAKALPAALRSHCVRIPGSGVVVNCLPLRNALVCVGSRYTLPAALRGSLTGLAGLANASKKGDANAKLVVVRNDDAVPWRRLRARELVESLEPEASPQACRDIEKGEEITFYYKYKSY